jgi:hypothetical protein
MRKRNQCASLIDHDLPWEVSTRGWQRVRSQGAVYETESAAVAIEEHTLATIVAGHDPFLCSILGGRGPKHLTSDPVAAHLVFTYEIDDLRLRRYAPTLAARARMAALVAGMDIEAERGHVGIISGHTRQRKKPIAAHNRGSNLIGNYKTEGVSVAHGQDC